MGIPNKRIDSSIYFPSAPLYCIEHMTVQIQIGDSLPKHTDLLQNITQYQLLPTLLKALIIDHAVADIELTPEEETIALRQFYEQHQLTEESQQQWLSHHRMSIEQLQQQALRQFKLSKFKILSWNSVLESDFLKYKPHLDQYTYSLIRHSSAELTQELYFRIQEKEQTFAELASKYSEGSEAKTGGLIGPVAANTLHPALVQILSSSQSGQIWPPQRIDEWNIIVRLDLHSPAQLTESVRQRLLEQRYQTWLDEQLKTARLIPNLSLMETAL
jgi:parvulin-like peptidyl-prolyl isomerase